MCGSRLELGKERKYLYEHMILYAWYRKWEKRIERKNVLVVLYRENVEMDRECVHACVRALRVFLGERCGEGWEVKERRQ